MSFGLRIFNADTTISLDTPSTTVRGLYKTTVTGTGAFRQDYSIPQIVAGSSVVVVKNPASAAGSALPAAFWTVGVLTLYVTASGMPYDVYVIV